MADSRGHDPLVMARLEQLEAANARLRRLATSAFVGMAILLGIGAAVLWLSSKRGLPGTVAESVEARQFVVRDRDGNVRGAWGFGDDGALRLVLQNQADQRSVKLNLLPDGTSGLTFADSIGNPRMVLALLPDATGSLAFADESGRTRSAYGINPNGSVSLVFADQRGNTRAGFGVDPRGRSMLELDPEAAAAASDADTSGSD